MTAPYLITFAPAGIGRAATLNPTAIGSVATIEGAACLVRLSGFDPAGHRQDVDHPDAVG
jgi:hypothetical protein